MSAPLIPGSDTFYAVQTTLYGGLALIYDTIQVNSISAQTIINRNISIANGIITGLIDPINNDDALTRNYFDNYVYDVPGTSNQLFMNNNSVITAINVSYTNDTLFANSIRTVTASTFDITVNSFAFKTSGLIEDYTLTFNLDVPLSEGLGTPNMVFDGLSSFTYENGYKAFSPGRFFCYQYNDGLGDFKASLNFYNAISTMRIYGLLYNDGIFVSTVLRTPSLKLESTVLLYNGSENLTYILPEDQSDPDKAFLYNGTQISYTDPVENTLGSVPYEIQVFTSGTISSSSNLTVTSSTFYMNAEIIQSATTSVLAELRSNISKDARSIYVEQGYVYILNFEDNITIVRNGALYSIIKRTDMVPTVIHVSGNLLYAIFVKFPNRFLLVYNINVLIHFETIGAIESQAILTHNNYVYIYITGTNAFTYENITFRPLSGSGTGITVSIFADNGYFYNITSTLDYGLYDVSYVQEGSVDFGTFDPVIQLFQSANLLVLLTITEIILFDINNPEPVYISTTVIITSPAITQITRASIHENYLVVPVETTIQIYDFSNPLNVFMFTSFNTNYVRVSAVSEGLLYLPTNDGLYVYDIKYLPDVIEQSSLKFFDQISEIINDGTYFYVIGPNLSIFDRDMNLMSYTELSSAATNIIVRGSQLFIGTTTGLLIYNIRNKKGPVLLSNLTLGLTNGLYLYNDFLYTTINGSIVTVFIKDPSVLSTTSQSITGIVSFTNNRDQLYYYDNIFSLEDPVVPSIIQSGSLGINVYDSYASNSYLIKTTTQLIRYTINDGIQFDQSLTVFVNTYSPSTKIKLSNDAIFNNNAIYNVNDLTTIGSIPNVFNSNSIIGSQVIYSSFGRSLNNVYNLCSSFSLMNAYNCTCTNINSDSLTTITAITHELNTETILCELLSTRTFNVVISDFSDVNVLVTGYYSNISVTITDATLSSPIILYILSPSIIDDVILSLIFDGTGIPVIYTKKVSVGTLEILIEPLVDLTGSLIINIC